MTSGRKLTHAEASEIIRLARQVTEDGRWRWPYSQIAARLGFDRKTIYQVIRQAAVREESPGGSRRACV